MGLPIEINLNMASRNTLGTEIRSGLFKNWLDKGYEITLYSPVKRKDLRWLGKIKYELMLRPKDEDVLFIEMGVSNVLYKYKLGGLAGFEKSYITRMLDCIESFKGKVVYYQHGCLNFPFKEYSKKIDLYKDKEWEVVHHFTNNELFKETFYKDVDVKCVFKPLGYSDKDPYFKIKEKPKHDSLFIGSEWDSASKNPSRRRFNEIRNFYDTIFYEGVVIGKWQPNTVKKFEHLTFLGHIGTHGDAYTYWNDSWSCIWTTSPLVKKLGLIPTRPIMALRSGCLLLADKELNKVEEYVDSKYLISTPEEAHKILEEHKKKSLKDREQIRSEQLKKFPKWGEVTLI